MIQTIIHLYICSCCWYTSIISRRHFLVSLRSNWLHIHTTSHPVQRVFITFTWLSVYDWYIAVRLWIVDMLIVVNSCWYIGWRSGPVICCRIAMQQDVGSSPVCGKKTKKWWTMIEIVNSYLQLVYPVLMSACVKFVPDMTYNVFGGTLNPTLLFSSSLRTFVISDCIN